MTKKSKLHISFILDETGSMNAVKDQTISGFNEYLTNLQANQDTKDALFTLTQFNSAVVEVVCADVPLADVKPLNDDTYKPDHTTPLYDAIGSTIAALEAKLKGKKKPAVLVVIQTDGQENSSIRYSQREIFAMIEAKKKEGWTFAFLGADQDAYLASERIGISRGNTLAYAGADTHKTLGSTTMRGTVAFAAAAAAGLSTEDLFSDEEEPVPAAPTLKDKLNSYMQSKASKR